MKKTLVLIFAATLMLSTAFAKKRELPVELETEVKQVLSSTDLTPDMTKELLEGKHPRVAIECPEGRELPFKYMGDFGLFSVNFFPNLSVKVEKTCYFRFIKKSGRASPAKGYMSYDLKTWGKAKDFLPKGKLDANLGMSKDKSHVVLETATQE